MNSSLASGNLASVLDCNNTEAEIYVIEVCPDGENSAFSYSDFRSQTCALARGLCKAGYERGDVIGIAGGNSVQFLVAYFAVMKAGMIAAPINYKLSTRVIEHIISDANIRLVLADTTHASEFNGLVKTHIYDGSGFGYLVDDGDFETVTMAEDDVATILYTSGSSGFPKGVPLTHGGYLWATEVHPTRHVLKDARVLVAAPFYHMNALFQSKIIARYGQTMVLMQQFDANRYIESIDRHACTNLTSVPTMLAMVLRETDAIANGDFSSVRSVGAASARRRWPCSTG